MNRKKAIRIVVVLLAAAIGVFVWRHGGERDIGNESRLVLYGNVDIRETDLAFNNSEHINRILVQEGDHVSEGQLLVTLHDGRMKAEVAAARAKVAARMAALARLQSGSRPEEVAQARANVASAEARLQDAQNSFNRTQELHKKKTVSQQTLDDAQARLVTARADLKVAEQALALAVQGPRSEDIDEAKAMLNADQAQLDLTQEVLKDTELFAPVDGVIQNRILEPGDMASPLKPVLTLAMTNPVWVRAYAPETKLGRLAPGMKAEVSTDSYPGKTYHGWIGFISPTAEFTPKNVETTELRTRLVYQLRVFICNPQDELRLGMPATVAIPLDQPKPQPGHTAPDCAAPADA